jgi:hypothetical protein
VTPTDPSAPSLRKIYGFQQSHLKDQRSSYRYN